jgi:aryl-alcohol dehydrogenase-like predicted oxidoreductase
VEYGRLGNSGLLVSKIGLGTNNFGGRLDLAGTRAVIERALDQGITLFDTADIYGRGKSEEFIGEVLGSRRHEVVLATKFGGAMGESPYERGASRNYLMRAVERSLRRLGTDYIDLYQVHFPDPATPIHETLQGLDDLVRSGKVRYVGHSNFAGWQIADAAWTARTEHLVRPISAQHEYNLLSRDIQREVLPAIGAFGLGLLPYFPLASGFLTGKYHRDALPEGTRLTSPSSRMGARILTDANWERLARLTAFAADHGHQLIELAFGWLLAQPAVGSVIAGAMTPEQVDSNVTAGLAWRLSPTQLDSVPALDTPTR